MLEPKTIKIIEENIGNKISDIACSNLLLDMSPQARETNKQNKQIRLHQTKKFSHSKRRQPTEWENIFGDLLTKRCSGVRAGHQLQGQVFLGFPSGFPPFPGWVCLPYCLLPDSMGFFPLKTLVCHNKPQTTEHRVSMKAKNVRHYLTICI